MEKFFCYVLCALATLTFTNCSQSDSEKSVSHLVVIPLIDEGGEVYENEHVLNLTEGKYIEVDTLHYVQDVAQFHGDWAVASFEEEGKMRYNYINTQGEFLNKESYRWASDMRCGRAYVVTPGGYITMIKAHGSGKLCRS